MARLSRSAAKPAGGQARDGRTRPETRERLLEAATIVFAEKGYYAAAVDDIVQVSQTSKGSFYNFFPSKQDLFLALVDRLADRLVARIEEAIATQKGALSKVDAALKAALDDLSKHRRIARILFIEAVGLGHAFNEKFFQVHSKFAGLIEKYLTKAVEEGAIPEIDTRLAALAWFGAINEVVIGWLYTGEPADLQDALPSLRSLLLRSVGAPVDREGRLS